MDRSIIRNRSFCKLSELIWKELLISTRISEFPIDICQWKGISCVNDVITEIDVSGSNLYGNINFEWLPYTVKKLILNKNELNFIDSKPLKTSSLQILDMRFNKLKNINLNVFSKLSALKNIYFAQNRLQKIHLSPLLMSVNSLEILECLNWTSVNISPMNM